MLAARIAVPFTLLALTACSGGGGGSTGAVTGLQAPSQVTIIEAQGNSTAQVRLPGGVLGVGVTDYVADPTRFWIRDESMEALDTVNMILGYLHETNYWDDSVMNHGAYIAMVTQNDRGGDGRGDNGPAYMKWTVESTRASDSAPQVVKFWLSEQSDGGPVIIYGRLTVTTEPTDSNPFGVFTLYFKQLPESSASTSTDTEFEGYMRSIARTDGQAEIEFYQREGDITQTPSVGQRFMRQRAHVIGDPTNDTGRAYTEWMMKENWGSPQESSGEFNVQFNASYMGRKNLGDSSVVVLDRNDFDSYVHRYGVYDATTETRSAMSGGFSLETANGDNGYVGYWGMWFPESVTLTDGTALYRRSYSDGSLTPYTAVVVPGRLEQRVRSTITLGDIKDEDLDTFSPTLGQEVRCRYDGTDLVCVALRQGNDWTTVTPPTSLAQFYTQGMYCNFYSQARGCVEFIWPATLNDSVSVNVWTSTTVTGSSAALAGGNLTLYGYSRRLKAGLTQNQANFLNGELPYLNDATNVNEGQTYLFDATTLQLTLGGVPVTLASGVTVTQGPGMWGFDCGPMFTTQLGALSEMATQTTTYQWFTASEWNQLRTVKDGNGQFVTFDQPIRFTYTHSEPGSPYDGRTFMLDWDGSNLGGIPYEQDSNTGQYRPLLNIPTGTTVTAGSSTYKLKQLEGEQFMVEVGDPSAVVTSEGFDLDTAITAPDISFYTDPAIGDRPTVTTPPKFVGGVAQN